jgi:hypothetical protein
LQKRLTEKRIHVSFLAEYPLATKWDFVTQELMKRETFPLDSLAELSFLAGHSEETESDAETDELDDPTYDSYDDDAEEASDDADNFSAEEPAEWERAGVPAGFSGGFVGFIYEEFHPNHAYDIERQVQATLRDFFENSFGDWSSHLSQTLVTDAGQRLTQKQFAEKVARFHDLFAGIKEWSFELFETAWQTEEDRNETLTGAGHVEGGVCYTVLTDDGAESEVRGSFKAYTELRDGWWSVCFFHLHGFSWA